MCTEKVKLVLLINTSIVLILLATCCGGNGWVKAKGKTAGLWKVCQTYDGHCTSQSPDRVTSFQKVIQAFTILSCIGAILSVFASVFILCVGEFDARYLTIGLFVTSFFIVIALCLFISYADEFIRRDPNYQYDWCFAVGWAGAAWAKISAINALCISVQIHKDSPVLV